MYCFISDDVAMVDLIAEYEGERLNKAKEEVKKSILSICVLYTKD